MLGWRDLVRPATLSAAGTLARRPASAGMAGRDATTKAAGLGQRAGVRRSGLLIAPLLSVVLVLCVGMGLRWFALGERPLEESELLHYFVAGNLNLGAGPVLPSGNVYTRGLETSRIIAMATPRVRPPELAVRAPSALFGSISLLLFAAVVWRMAGPWPAVAASALLSLYPEALGWSRTGRFYSLQLLLGLAAFYAAWRVFARSDARHAGSTTRDTLRCWSWATIAIVCMAVAAGIQIVTLSAAVGLATAWAIAAARDVRRLGRSSFRSSVPLQLCVLAAVAIPVILLLRPSLPIDLLDQARSVPFWARQSPGDVPGPLFYAYELGRRSPVVAALGPLAFVLLLSRRAWLGVYLLTWFAVPLLIHSLLPFRQERYILLALPALFTALAVAVSWGGEALHRELKAALLKRTGNLRLSRALAGALVGFAALGVFGPMSASAAKLVRDDMRNASSHPRWNRVQAILAENPLVRDLPIGTGHPLPALHYAGRVSFSVRQGFLERPAGHQALVQTGSAFRWERDGSPEYYAGVPVFAKAASIRDRFRAAGGVLIVLEARELGSAGTTPELRQLLEAEARELCRGTCGSLRLFHWQFPPAGTSS